MAQKIMETLIIIIVGLMFVEAGGSKAMLPYNFLALVSSYQLLPGPYDMIVSSVLPPLEILAGALLIFNIMPNLMFGVLAFLATIFLCANSYALILGRGIDECGCFGLLFQMPLQVSMVIDVLIVVAAFWHGKR